VPAGKVLLILEVLIGSDKHVESILRFAKQVTIVEVGPAHFSSRRNGVTHELMSQRRRRALIKQNLHAIQFLSFNEALARMRQNSLDLIAGDAWKPVEKIVNSRAILQILK
jgi:hypothetical protein